MKACLSGTGRVQYLLLACCLFYLVPRSHCGKLFFFVFRVSFVAVVKVLRISGVDNGIRSFTHEIFV